LLGYRVWGLGYGQYNKKRLNKPKRTQFSKIALAATLGIAITFTFSCSSDDGGGVDKGNDIGNYRTVQIGNQKWMAENLNYNVSSSKCYGEDGQIMVDYDEETETYIYTTLSNAEIQANCDKYGRLYDWATAKTICPSGWHLPSDAEWQTLINYVETQKSCNDCAGKYLKATSSWNDYYDNFYGEIFANGTDEYGFSALPGGYGLYDGHFRYVGSIGFWWSATEDAGSHNTWDMGYISSVTRDHNDEENLYSVRCIYN
jgi:uncharacterized protein (TIGR02145 family)